MQASDQRPLEKWDPAEAWRPWQPTPEQPWNLKWAGHLLRRAAFGYAAARPGEDAWDSLSRAIKQGFDSTLAELFQPAGADFNELLDTTGEQIALDDDEAELRGWWLYRMLHTPQPLVERMTLFWHNHFATSVRKVRRVKWMFAQNQTLRQHALGKLAPLVLAISRDPAMIVWLDLQHNVKGHPNENFGREIMELFTLGTGHYTEKDVQEVARAFTGWRVYDDRFEFDAESHDDGPKTLFGQMGNLNGDDIVKIMLAQPATARFIVRKLFRQFISEVESPSDALIEPLAQDFRDSDYDIGPLVRRILSSRLFFSETSYHQRIKSPVEYIVGAWRGLNCKGAMKDLVSPMNGMGQDLFAPPNVSGWSGGKTWLNSATLLARHNMIASLVFSAKSCNPGELMKRHAGEGAAQIEFLRDLFLQEDLPEAAKKSLVAYLVKDAPKDAAADRRLREALHMLLILPDYHLA